VPAPRALAFIVSPLPSVPAGVYSKAGTDRQRLVVRPLQRFTIVVIRPAEVEDVRALVGLLDELGYPANAAAVVRRLDILFHRDDCSVLVAIDEGGVIGFGTLHIFPVIHEDAPRGQITALVVSQPCRGRGIGGELVRQLEQRAQEKGVGRIVVATANHRLEAHDFYERLGYEWTGRRYARLLDPAGPR
jgi:ribosomal protein S18 acetylase RimI-like enzyme